MKICTSCKEAKDLCRFYKNKSGKFGITSRCKDCIKLLEQNRNDSSKRKMYRKTYRKEIYNEIEAKRNKLRYNTCLDYKSKVKQAQKLYYQKNKYKFIAASAKYRAAKLNATLNGFTKELELVYKNCPKGYHVDHIYPLQNPKCCGLHVPWNLQYLPASENYSKSNKLPID